MDKCFACGRRLPTEALYYYSDGTPTPFCQCLNPVLANPLTTVDKPVSNVEKSEPVDNSVRNGDNVIHLDEDYQDLRMGIAVEAMVAIESANFENAHQAAITVEQVADRAVRMADALLERLKY